MKRIGLLIGLLLLLTACGLSAEDVPTDGLTNAVGPGSQSVVMSGGSTMIRNYYEGTVATGGLFTAVSNITNCWVVFEPNGENARIFVQLKPQGDTFIFGQDAPPQFVGGGAITPVKADTTMPKGAFRASCEGKVGLTAVPIKVSGTPVVWLAAIDLSNAVWKAPAGTELSEFFSENGYRSILLMTTDSEVDVPETAVAKAYDLNPNDLSAYDLNPNDLSAYDLNPNDLSVTDDRCVGLYNTSDADIGPIFRGIMFETLIGRAGMLVLGDGNALGSVQTQSAHPFTCADSKDVQVRSADLELGKFSYQLVALRYPEITLHLGEGKQETLPEISVLGIVPSP